MSGINQQFLGIRPDGAGGGGAGTVVQVVNFQTGAVSTTSAVIPTDDTIPQIGEGAQMMTLSITPKAATNRLKIDVTMNLSYGVAQRVAAALFQDAGPGAFSVHEVFTTTAGGDYTHSFTDFITAGTTSPTSINVHLGVGGGGTVTLNGVTGVRKYGGAYVSSITITEIRA